MPDVGAAGESGEKEKSGKKEAGLQWVQWMGTRPIKLSGCHRLPAARKKIGTAPLRAAKA